MEQRERKIDFFVTRTFGEKLSVTFSFIRENWRPMLKYFTYFLLPVCIVLAFCLDQFFASYMKAISTVVAANVVTGIYGMVMKLLGLFVAGVVASLLLISLIYAMMRIYRQRDEGLKGLTFDELKPVVMHCMGRSLRLLCAAFVLVIMVGLLIALLVFVLSSISPALAFLGLLLFYVALIAVMLPLGLACPAYMLDDDITLLEAFQKSLRLGFATWGGVFAVVFTLGLVGGILQTFTTMPWYVMLILKQVFTLQTEASTGFVQSVGYSFLQYLACVLECIGMLVASILNIVGVTVQYGHACDKIDGVSVTSDIERFEDLDNI